MRLSIADNVVPVRRSRTRGPDPSAPNLGFLTQSATALDSFFATIGQIVADNPVATARLVALAGQARAGQISDAEQQELQALKLAAVRQGRAVGAAIGFFFKFKPYPALEEIRQHGK